MRTLVLDDYRRLAIHDRPAPRPGPGEVLVEVAAVGICGSDLHGWTGENGRRVPGQIMGHEASGRVAELGSAGPGEGAMGEGATGEDLGELAVGAPVTYNPLIGCGRCRACRRGTPQRCADRQVIGVTASCPGGFTEYLVVPARNLVPLPAALPVVHGALVEPLAVAVHAVRRTTVAAGDVVLVVGGGPIGQSVALAVETYGPELVVVSEPNPRRRQLCEQLGATTVDPTTAPLAEQVRERGGRLADVTIDAVGGSRSVSDALLATEPGGDVVLVGMGSPELTLAAYDISTLEHAIVGSFCYAPTDFTDAVTWAADHAHRLEPLVSAEVGLAEAAAAFESLDSAAAAAGKILVLPTR